MKNLKTLLLIAVFTLGVGVANAQKLAHIDFQKIVSELPKAKSLKADLERVEATYKAEIEEKAKKLENKIKKYQAEAASQTPERNQAIEKELQGDNQKFQVLRKTAAEEIQKKLSEGLKPLYKKVQDAIDQVAKAKGIQYVFDSSVLGNAMLVKNGTDLYNDVKAKLGL